MREGEQVGGSRGSNNKGGGQSDGLVSRKGAAESQARDNRRGQIGAAEMQGTMCRPRKLAAVGMARG